MKFALCALLSLALFSAPEQEDAKKPYKVGTKVKQEIELVDLDGKPRALIEETDEQYLVLVFWSLRDPASRIYEKRLMELQKEFAAQDAVLFLVASSYDEIFSRRTDPLEKIKKHVKDSKLTLPILIDHGNVVADDFGALTSGHVFVFDRKRFIRYSGGIDDDPKGVKEKAKQEYRKDLRDALVSVLAGEIPKRPVGRPTGRKIKRAPKGAAKDGGTSGTGGRP